MISGNFNKGRVVLPGTKPLPNPSPNPKLEIDEKPAEVKQFLNETRFKKAEQ